MAMRKRYHILGCTLALIAVVVFLSATSRTSQDSGPDQKREGGLGSAEEAFNIACASIKDYLSTQDGESFLIDPQFRATLLSKSKLWTIKGYAFCPHDDSKSYRWTVILNYHDMQDWEVLAKIVTPEYTASNSNQIVGVPEVQGKLFQENPSH
jgi:hypothetical protein